MHRDLRHPIKPREGGGAEAVISSNFSSVDFYQVHLELRDLRTFTFYLACNKN